MVLPNATEVMNCNTWSAEQWADMNFIKETCGDLQPNNDIAGIGVMIGFVATSCLTILLSLAKGVCLAVKQDRDTFLWRFLVLNEPDNSTRRRWVLSKPRAEFWNRVFGKLVLGLADQQMVTGFAILVAAIHIWPRTAAYNFYIMAHVAAFAILTQSMAFLVLFDFIHNSLTLYAVRALVYSVTLALFYTCAHLSYDLTGEQGYQAACPATCMFKKSGSKFSIVVFAGVPIFAFILADLIREMLYRLEILKKPDKNAPRPKPQELNIFQKIRYYTWHYGFHAATVLAWLYTIADLGIALWSVWSSWDIKEYQGLALEDGYTVNTWDFGQLVAVILIPLPFLSLAEEFKSYSSEKSSLGEERSEAYPEGILPQHKVPVGTDHKSSTLTTTEKVPPPPPIPSQEVEP